MSLSIFNFLIYKYSVYSNLTRINLNYATLYKNITNVYNKLANPIQRTNLIGLILTNYFSLKSKLYA